MESSNKGLGSLKTPKSRVVAVLPLQPLLPQPLTEGRPCGASAERCQLQPRPEPGFMCLDDSRAESKEAALVAGICCCLGSACLSQATVLVW